MNKRGILLLLLSCLVACGRVAERDTPYDISLTSANTPLPNEAFRANIELAYTPSSTMAAGDSQPVHLLITNFSQSNWPSLRNGDGTFQLAVGNHWRDARHRVVVTDDGRQALPYDLKPGARAEVMLRVTAPAQPGQYFLEFDLVQENVAWFAEKGSRSLTVPVMVDHK